MKRAHAIVISFALVLGGAGSFWAWSRAQANAPIPFDPSLYPPQTAPEPEKTPEDARVAGLKERADGARLLWVPEEGTTLLRAGFVDNRTMALTVGEEEKGHRLFSYDIATRAIEDELTGKDERLSSAHRPAHKNADAFCFSEKNENSVFEIWCSDYDWKSPKRLTTHDGREDLVEPAIAPGGDWVAFEVNRDRVPRASKGEAAVGTSSVWKIGLNGAGLQELTRGSDDRFPTWSEDGRRVYFQRRNLRGDWDIYVINSDGSDPRPVMRTEYDDERWPTPVADTGRLAVVMGPKGEIGSIRLLDTKTKASYGVTSGAYGQETVLSVSPDGKLVSFLALVDPSDPARQGLWLKEIE